MEFECINWMLKRMDAEVVRGAEVPKPPQERGEACRLHASEAEWEAFRCSTAAGPLGRKRVVALGPLCTRTFVVNNESSTVRTPPVRHGPCSGIGRRDTAREVGAAV